MNHDKIAVIDFGGQYAHLIATKVRAPAACSPRSSSPRTRSRPSALQGHHPLREPGPRVPRRGQRLHQAIYDLPVPILGFCFGHQEIAKHYGGKVEHTQREYGPAVLHLGGRSPDLPRASAPTRRCG